MFLTKKIPKLSKKDINQHFVLAKDNISKRALKILHRNGDFFNKVFVFLLKDTYMQPHLHPGYQKKEKMFLFRGSFCLLFFNDNGKVVKKILLDDKKKNYFEIPPFTWHTYVMTSENVVIYETMNGIYNPKTWKKMANWAPKENSRQAKHYFKKLKTYA